MKAPTQVERLDELAVLVAVARGGSLSAAARLLNIPIHRASRKLTRLEERLGVVLVARTTRSLRLTEEGARLVPRAQRVLDEVNAAELELFGGQHLRGTIRLSLPTLLLQQSLLDELTRAPQMHPELEIELLVQDGPVNLMDSGCDIVVVAGRPGDSSMTMSKLGTIRPQLAATTQYLERAAVLRSPSDLTNHLCLRFIADKPQTHWSLVSDKGRRRSVAVGRGFASNNSRALFDAMCNGSGIGLATEAQLRQHPQLKRVLPRYQHVPFELFALYPPEQNRSARTTLALSLLRNGLQLVD